MSPSVSGALPFTSKSKKKYEIMNSKIMTKYQVDHSICLPNTPC